MVAQRKILLALFLITTFLTFSQTDFSNRWEDHFSYNKVRDFVIRDEVLYAIADNAVFTYQINTEELNKISSVNGLSGETTSTIFYDDNTRRLLIGYRNGLIEIIEPDGRVRVALDIVNFTQAGEKNINHISVSGDILYLSLPFGIVEYNIANLEFGDTFFIGQNSEAVEVRETLIVQGNIYAITANGLYVGALGNGNLIDFNNWSRISTINVTHAARFNNQLFVSSANTLYRLTSNILTPVRTFSAEIVSLDANANHLVISESNKATVLDVGLNPVVEFNGNTSYDFTLNKAMLIANDIYLATQEFGVLQASFANPSEFLEIHPDGPIQNDVFSLNVKEDNLWVVYGGFRNDYSPLNTNLGFSFFNGGTWNNIAYDPNDPLPDLVDITFDPNNTNKVYISSFGSTSNLDSRETGGLLVVEDAVPTVFYNQNNSGIEDILQNTPSSVSIRISGSTFDNQGNLWLTNIGTPNELKKFSNGSWSSIDISGVPTGFGLTQIIADRANNIWIGSRSSGAIVYNENGNRLRSLNTNATQGSLPNNNVRTIAADRNNRIWIGTLSGLVVFNNANSVFNVSNVDAEPIVFLEDGVPRRLLGDQTVNSIVVDGANNKWFGTENGGVVFTNPNGRETLAVFNKDNSPLPSNKIVKIAVDATTGKVYFATDRGIVAYDSNVSPFGTELGEVYAYPNPARRNHQSITIAGRNNTNLPRGTNVKILDVAGNLVFETNVVEGQQLNGGKVIWDKRNLAGRFVASGIYIVLLSNDEATETSTAKIAIIN